jgi:5-methyltetrahydrofolate--homocysteine methyltransferase
VTHSEATSHPPVPDLDGPAPARRTEAELRDFLAERVLVLDGATGTGFQARDLGPDDFGGPDLEGCNEHLVFTRPDVVVDLHSSYLAAGADMVQTNTFGGTGIVLAEYGLADRVLEINRRAADLAKRTAAAFATKQRPRFVAGSIGPTTKAISVTGGITFDALVTAFRDQAAGLIEGGVDVLLIETQQDTRNAKAALIGADDAMAITGIRVPVMLSGTIENTGTMLGGQSIEAFWTSVSHFPLLSVGLNCATGPAFMTDHLRTLSALATTHVSCAPNAGLPDEEGRYHETPESMGKVMALFLDERWVNVIGGCCGTTPDHVRVFARLAQGARPRIPAPVSGTRVSGIDYLEVTEDIRPVLVGERTNLIGSRKFRRLIEEEKYEEAAEIGRRQVRGGAQVLDICLQDPDRDELADVRGFYERIVRMVRTPLMIDSTNAEAIERALTYCQGKVIINSVNLEEGENRLAAVCPLARKYGAALVVGTIDEDPVQGMAVTRERKLSIARRSYDLLVNRYGIAPGDILWDPLVFPAGTGDPQYVGAAEETIAAIPLLRSEFPGTRTILGISNVSFGLPTAGREILNSVFLHDATKAGLDFAIVNAQRLERHGSIPPEEIELAEDVLFARGEDPVGAFVAHFRKGRTRVRPEDARPRSLDERLAACIVEGTKDGLVADLDRKLAEGVPPLDIINGPLMEGMAEVGRLFNDNRLIVAEVLQSAEAMKAAVSHLEPHLEKTETASRGKVVLATVKGDVHDIGKNLVEIVFTNNGYNVIDLGIRVPPETLIEACREHSPDIVGLSGLLVKSAHMMVSTAEDMTRAGTTPPLLVGGAALSERFALTKIDPSYAGPVFHANDAMAGLSLADRILGAGGGLDMLRREMDARRRRLGTATRRGTEPVHDAGSTRSSRISVLPAAPAPPDLDRHQEEGRLIEIWPWINPQMLYGRHLGLKGRIDKLLAAGDEKARGLKRRVEMLQGLAENGRMRARAVWQWYRAESEGNTIRVLGPDGSPLEELTFRRQPRPDGLCIADWVKPAGAGNDWLGMFVTTVGEGVREWAAELKQSGEYLDSHAVQALALESAEGYAESLHARMRRAWNLDDEPGAGPNDQSPSRYRGIRVSFGYPACPDLEDQAKLWRLLRPEEIGVELTEEFMMSPEASVSAIVFHHPQAAYFGVGDTP